MPTNLYGPHDNFDLESSHVLPALIRKFVDAINENQTSIILWGSGNPRREFLHVDVVYGRKELKSSKKNILGFIGTELVRRQH